MHRLIFLPVFLYEIYSFKRLYGILSVCTTLPVAVSGDGERETPAQGFPLCHRIVRSADFTTQDPTSGLFSLAQDYRQRNIILSLTEKRAFKLSS